MSSELNNLGTIDATESSPLLIQVTPGLVGLCIALLAIHRLWLAALRCLTPDEALYWVWSRHLSLGYLDHPPMIAYLIRLSTSVLGSSELGVRVLGVLMTLGAGIIVMWIVQKLTHEARATYLAGIILLLNPLLLVMGMIFTPDTPACFFSIAALACLATMENSQEKISPSRWLFFGLFTGCAMLSKYTAITPAFAIFLAMLTSRWGRAELRRPWPYFAALIAAIVFSPVIYWNATHQWASFRFQLDHGVDANRSNPLGFYLLGQATVFTPVLFIMGIIVLFWSWRRVFTFSRTLQLLLWSATVPLIFFGIASLRARGELNWPDYAYFPLTALIVFYVVQTWSGARLKWAIIGCVVAAGASVVLQVPELLWKLHVPLPTKMADLVAWDDMAEEISEIRGDLPAVADRYQDAAEFTFYDRDHSEIWEANLGPHPIGYDFLSRKPDLHSYQRLAFIGFHYAEFAQMYGFDIEKSQQAQTILPNSKTRDRMVTIMRRHEKS